jgi:hypothetical protein
MICNLMAEQDRVSRVSEGNEDQRDSATAPSIATDTAEGRMSSSMLKNTYRVTMCIFYITLSLALIILFDGKDQHFCRIRDTYQKEFLGNVAGNPFFSYSQLIKPTPRSKHEILAGVALEYNTAHHKYDVSMFPTMIREPHRDAAYLPVDIAFDVPVSVIFKDTPGISLVTPGNLDMITLDKEHQLISTNIRSQIVHKITGGFQTAGVDITKKEATSAFLDRRNGTYHILRNGRIVAPDIGHPLEVSNLVTGMYYQGVHTALNEGVLPNINRCVSANTPHDTFIENMNEYENKSHLRGACISMAQQASVDIATDYRTTFTIFSSVDIYYMLLSIIWVSASFSVFYFPQFDRVGVNTLKKEGFIPSLSDVTATLPIAWNLILIIYSIFRRDRLPLNNVLLTIILVFVTTLFQVIWASVQGSEEVPRTRAPFPRGPNADYYSLTARDLEYAANKDGLRARNVSAHSFRTTFDSTPVFTSGYYADYLAVHKAKPNGNNTMRFVQYTLLTPLIFVITLVATQQNVPTNTVQFIWVLLMLFHILCIPIANVETQTACKITLISIQFSLLVVILSVYCSYIFQNNIDYIETPGTGMTVAVFTIICEVSFLIVSLVDVITSSMEDVTLDKKSPYRPYVTSAYSIIYFTLNVVVIVMMTIATEEDRWGQVNCNKFAVWT